MNTERLLRDALHEAYGAARPPVTLEPTIREAIRVQPRRSSPLRFAFGAAAAAVVVVALAFGAISSRGRLGPAASHTPNAPASASAVSSAARTNGDGHFEGYGIAFDYPPEWHLWSEGMGDETSVAVVGTGNARKICPTPRPSSPTFSPRCQWQVSIGQGEIMASVFRMTAPGNPPIDPSVPASPGTRYTTVGGLPAILAEEDNGDDLLLTWSLSIPGDSHGRFVIDAHLRNPGIESLRAKLEAMIATVRFGEPPAGDAATVTAKAVSWIKGHVDGMDCFPDTPGSTASGTISFFSYMAYFQIPTPIEATCATNIAPASGGQWNLTLTLSWPDTAAYRSGFFTVVYLLEPDATIVNTTTTPAGPYFDPGGHGPVSSPVTPPPTPPTPTPTGGDGPTPPPTPTPPGPGYT